MHFSSIVAILVLTASAQAGMHLPLLYHRNADDLLATWYERLFSRASIADPYDAVGVVHARAFKPLMFTGTATGIPFPTATGVVTGKFPTGTGTAAPFPTGTGY